MKKIRCSAVQVAGLAVALFCWAQPVRLLAQDAPPLPGEELPAGAEVLTSGPVHEAFAKPVTMQHEAGIEVPLAPPPNMTETPPIERPVGATIVWVPGYWAWAAERNDFIWVSGCWRSAPPHMHWVPGYWRAVERHHEWVSGFWTAHMEAQPQLDYVPAPPATVELEPAGQPPLPDHFWVPGCWYRVHEQWVLRHGYWHAPQLGWVWVPSRYAWTPRGYIFCAGYWDHDLDNRGVLFSPVHFPAGLRGRADVFFMPNICVDLGVFRLHLFAYPRYHHYYFGDFYDDAYLRAGIYPWFECASSHTWYDPLFVYDRWHAGHGDPHWLEHQQHHYADLREHRELRPARTYTEFQAHVARLPVAERSTVQLVTTLQVHAASKATPMKFERVTTLERKQIVTRTAEAHVFREQRAQWEAPAATHEAAVHHPVEIKPTHENTPHPPEIVKVAHETVPQPAPRNVEHPKELTHTPVVPPHEVHVAQPGTPTPQPAHNVERPREIVHAPMAPPHPVRATQTEHVQIPAPPIVAHPAETRYIQKEPPAHPTQEHSHLEPNATPPPHQGFGKDAQKKN